MFFDDNLAHVDLPGPDLFGDIELVDTEELYLSVSDISQIYNRLSARWLWRFFGLPKIWVPSYNSKQQPGYLFPALTVIPMGWNLAVRFAQAVHLHTLFRVGVEPRQILIKGLYNPQSSLEDGLFSPYIDDLGVFGTSLKVNCLNKRVQQEKDKAGLPDSAAKSKPASVRQGYNSLLGMDFYKNDHSTSASVSLEIIFFDYRPIESSVDNRKRGSDNRGTLGVAFAFTKAVSQHTAEFV